MTRIKLNALRLSALTGPGHRKLLTGLAATAATALVATALAAATATTASAAPGLAPLIGPGGTAVSAATVRAASTKAVVKDSYIVVLKDAAGLKAAGVPAGSAATLAKAAAARGTSLGAEVDHTFSSALAGYSGTLSSSELTAVRADPAVKYVQQDLRYTDTGTTQKAPDSWGLDRIDQRSRPLSDSYYYSATGNGVRAYILDTGIFAEHPDFEGRVVAGIDEFGSTDGRLGRIKCDGHGTHVAGTVGGKFYGVAKRVTLVPVRVLDCSGTGSTKKIVAGLDWVIANHVAPAVVNMSLGTDAGIVDPLLNDAVQRTTDAGITVVVSAGNGNSSGRGVDACTVSPASAPTAITVGASTTTDNAASFSNFGTCLDLYAPGVSITSDWNTISNNSYTAAVLDGTSQASPHVAGVAAMYLEKHPTATPAQVDAGIKAVSSKAIITGVPAATPAYPHDLLFSLQPAPKPVGVTSGDRLLSDQNLLRGARLYSSNNLFFLAHRSSDGWLSLYDATTGKVIWATGHNGSWTNMNTSGSLSSYDNYGRRSWSTNTPNGAATMIVNGKGYVQLRRDSDKLTYWTSPH